MLFLSITFYVFRVVQHVLYYGCNILSCLYNLYLYLIDLNKHFIIQVDVYVYIYGFKQP